MDGKLGLRLSLVMLVALVAFVMVVQFAEAGYYGYGNCIFFRFQRFWGGFKSLLLNYFLTGHYGHGHHGGHGHGYGKSQ